MSNVDIKDYENIEEDFYDAQTKSLNPLRAWFHNKRFEIIRSLVNDNYKKGDIIAELACGNCNWNIDKIPVIGVDVSKKMLEYAYKKGRISKMLVEDCEHTSLKNNSISILILAEALEHMNNPKIVLSEIYRVLKKKGIFIVSVPYDTNFSLWKPLFKIQCFFQGVILGSDYYKKECGHVNHFSPKTLIALLNKYNFKVVRLFDNKRFTIFVVAVKL